MLLVPKYVTCFWCVNNLRNWIHFSNVLLFRSMSLKRASAPEARYPIVLLLTLLLFQCFFWIKKDEYAIFSSGWRASASSSTYTVTFHELYSFARFSTSVFWSWNRLFTFNLGFHIIYNLKSWSQTSPRDLNTVIQWQWTVLIGHGLEPQFRGGFPFSAKKIIREIPLDFHIILRAEPFSKWLDSVFIVKFNIENAIQSEWRCSKLLTYQYLLSLLPQNYFVKENYTTSMDLQHWM